MLGSDCHFEVTGRTMPRNFCSLTPEIMFILHQAIPSVYTEMIICIDNILFLIYSLK